MGVVYKAVDPLIDRTVAIKTINLNLSRDELADFEERFNREAKSAGRLNHPNIVTIYDVGRADHVAFMAMEYLEGRELKEIIASGRYCNRTGSPKSLPRSPMLWHSPTTMALFTVT